MLRLQRIFKNYTETGSLNEQVNLYGFIDEQVFLTKTGDLGVVLEVHGVDYECLDTASVDNLTKRLESALKLFDEKFRIYQYLFKRNKETIPFKTHDNPIVNTAIQNRVAYLASKANQLFTEDLLRHPLRGIPLQASVAQHPPAHNDAPTQRTPRTRRVLLQPQASRNPGR
jgi:type IV secretion system protein VirB4